MRRLLFAVMLLGLAGFSTQAFATWTGYWTWTGTSWVWTWIWYSPTVPVVSAIALTRGAALSADTADCCGITVLDFGSLQPRKVTYTGLLATDFVVNQESIGADLTLNYVGPDPIAPGTFLGTMTLDDPGMTPSSPPITFRFSEAFRDGSGDVLTETGAISTSLPEPATAALLSGALLCLASVRRRFGVRPTS